MHNCCGFPPPITSTGGRKNDGFSLERIVVLNALNHYERWPRYISSSIITFIEATESHDDDLKGKVLIYTPSR